jgi:hypothetical protein
MILADVLEIASNVMEVAVTIAGILTLVCLGLAALEALLELIEAFWSRRRDPEETTGLPRPTLLRPRPRLTLLVHHDPVDDVLRPSVQLHGGVVPGPGSVRLQLADGDERVRLSIARPLPPEATNRQLPFPAFAPPDGASVEEALGWHWDVVIENGEEEPFRWREHPRPTDGVNAEAELERPVA